ncbi:MAG: NAD-dependent epimerase/dehydratase [Parcubacteria group bacterium Gr01-1014_3]|nr:MAG: NAD-dependent epimerase/dehydratase [Parcubacteria group bacterium Gr01-1014_3]
MKYLVVGGAGFIGSNLVDELIKQKHEVAVLDNLSTGKKSNIHKKAKFIKADITKLKKLRPHFKGVDGVFHLAAIPRVPLSIEKPIETHEANVNGTLNVLMAARDAGVKRIVYSASSSAYGDTKVLPVHEELKPAPMSPYGLQKYIGEEYARIFALLYNMETVSLRYFNVYGPRMADAGSYLSVVKTFLNQKSAKQALSIIGDGEQTRSFTHVSDVVRANILAMQGKKVGKGEVINIGTPKSYSVNQIAKWIGGPRIYLPPRIEPKHSCADITKAKKLLGWSPKISLEKGIAELLVVS